MNRKKVVLGVGGSSGSIYARLLIEELMKIRDQWDTVGVVLTKNARVNWELEQPEHQLHDFPLDFYENDDFNAPFASGSARYTDMIICPCSMGMLSRIAHGISNDLMSRAADVMLKERRNLIVTPREMPYSLIHLENMTLLTRAGAMICPATPSFYHPYGDVEELLKTVVHRLMDLCGFEIKTRRWNDN